MPLKKSKTILRKSAKIVGFVLLVFLGTLGVMYHAFAYNFWGLHWHDEYTTFYYGSNLPASFKSPTWHAQQDTWDDGSPSGFYFECNSNSSHRVYYGGIDGPGGVLAYTWYDKVSAHKGYHFTDCDFKYDAFEFWHTDLSTPVPSDKYDAWSVAAHEFGHWLYLGHSNSSPDGQRPTMHERTLPGTFSNRTLSQDDKDGIWYIYEVWH